MCDTIVIVSPEKVFFAKNSDRDPNEAQRIEWHPRRQHPKHSRLRCTWIEIEQAQETYAVMLSRPFWMWGAEIGTNEHGVTIGNEAVFTNQPYAKLGLTGMDLLRLALERSKTAKEAVEEILRLLSTYGQGGGCGHEDRSFTYHNSFLVADPSGAFVLETAGREHAIEEVKGARSISNGLTIPGFREKYSDFVKTRASSCRVRQPRTQALASRVVGLSELMALLRDHGEKEAPHYSWFNGAMSAPCMHAGGIAANSQTTASWVAELSPKQSSHWVTATAAPCLSLFKPVRVDTPLDLGEPTDRSDASSLFWRHERLHRLVTKDYPRLSSLFLKERDEVEARWLKQPPTPKEAFQEADRFLSRWTQLVSSATPRETRPLWAKSYWHTRELRAGV